MDFALCSGELPIFNPVFTVYMLQILIKTNFLVSSSPSPSNFSAFKKFRRY